MLKKVSKSVTYTNFFNIHIDYTQGGSDVIKQKEKVFSRDPTLNYLKVVLHTYIHKYVRKKLYEKTSKHDVPLRGLVR